MWYSAFLQILPEFCYDVNSYKTSLDLDDHLIGGVNLIANYHLGWKCDYGVPKNNQTSFRSHQHITSLYILYMLSIRCQFLLPGGSMGPRYVLQLLLSEKITKLLITLPQLKLDKINKCRFGILGILEFFLFLLD